MSYNTGFGFTGFISGKDTSRYGNATMANPFSEGNDTGPGGQYMDPSTGNNEWYLRPPQNGGPVQPYTGVDVIGGLNNFQDPTSVGSTPFSWENHASLNGMQYSPFNAGVHNLPSRFATIPPPTVPAPPPAPTLSWPHRPSPLHPFPSASTANTLAFQNPVQNYPADLGTYGAGPSTQPVPRILPYIPPEEPYTCGCTVQTTIPNPGPFGFPSVPLTATNNPGVALPGTSLSPPAPWSSGPRRTTKRAKEKRIYNPLKSSAKKMGADKGEFEDGWSGALTRFQTALVEILFDEQLLEGLSFETALAAKITEFAKDDLKRSPLQDTKAGDGKRPRDVEDYLTGILREINPTGTPEAGRSGEIRWKRAFYAKVADTLEARLLPINTDSTLRQPPSSATRVGKGARLEQTEKRVKKNKREKSKRDGERSELERMGYFFKLAEHRQCWTRTEILSFVVLFFLYGSDIFSQGFVHLPSGGLKK